MHLILKKIISTTYVILYTLGRRPEKTYRPFVAYNFFKDHRIVHDSYTIVILMYDNELLSRNSHVFNRPYP